ncbi:hypothetical protein [Hymenobacter metallicola]|uniref:Uncharacterized protein n=1 Tax=Hymenobacter metallicola TaxID=2563114 RepID=A0A4Z0QEH2_9BACT|nr:hypothetical protein [Hymenobacter metallicola]TGE28437.1 hypothetical protein E5K02_02935 [Hymenobacter metallicola]
MAHISSTQEPPTSIGASCVEICSLVTFRTAPKLFYLGPLPKIMVTYDVEKWQQDLQKPATYRQQSQNK